MTSQSAFFHALLRPAILQILRATGYHAAKPSVVDSLTEIAARYLSTICEATASHAVHNHGDAGDYGLVDVRMALQDAGALQPERSATEEAFLGQEDLRGVEGFVDWFSGPRMRELRSLGAGEGESEATDYLNVLTKKHAKSTEDTKYAGTLIGRPLLEGTAEIQVEGGPVTSIADWIQQRKTTTLSATPLVNGRESPTLSSGLSSVGSRLGDDDMDLS